MEGIVTIIFSNYISATSLEQSRSRVRDFDNTVVDMVIYVPKENELMKEKLKLLEDIEEIEEYREGFFEEYQIKIDDAFKRQSLYKEGFDFYAEEFNEYEYNEIRLAALKQKVEEINLILSQKNKSTYYKQIIQELYPTADVVIGNRTNLFDYDSIIEKYVGEQFEVFLDKEDQRTLKKEFANLKVNLKHTADKIGLNQIKRILKENNSKYMIESYLRYDKRTKKSFNTWHIFR